MLFWRILQSWQRHTKPIWFKAYASNIQYLSISITLNNSLNSMKLVKPFLSIEIAQSYNPQCHNTPHPVLGMTINNEKICDELLVQQWLVLKTFIFQRITQTWNMRVPNWGCTKLVLYLMLSIIESIALSLCKKC